MIPPNSELNVCVLGLGYIGLPTAALLASRGIHVQGVDVVPQTVETINQGKVQIVEPDLDLMVQAATRSGKLQAADKPDPADIFIIAVPTPTQDDASGIPQPCIDAVLDAARAIAAVAQPGNLIIVESTSPVGTTRKVAQTLADSGMDPDTLHLAYCPERVLPGRIMKELVENDRIIGGLTPVAATAAKAFYQRFVMGTIYETTAETAEMVKLSENAYRDLNIAFANELSIISHNLGVDANELIRLANCHPRVNILQPGCGVGGHCIAVDPWFIVASDPENSKLIQQARKTNDYKSQWVMERIKEKYRGLDKKHPTVALCGLAFKPNIDDLRHAPALEIALQLNQETDATFLHVEPNISQHDTLTITPFQEAIQEADLIVLLVAHTPFLDGSLDSIDAPVLDFTCH